MQRQLAAVRWQRPPKLHKRPGRQWYRDGHLRGQSFPSGSLIGRLEQCWQSVVGSLFDVVSQPFVVSLLSFLPVPTVSPSRGWDVAVYVFDINQPSLSTPFNSVLVSVSVHMPLSTVFHSINSPDNSPSFLVLSLSLCLSLFFLSVQS